MGGYLGIMQKKMETTTMGYIGFRVWGLYRAYKGIWEYYWDNGKENGNFYMIIYRWGIRA